MRTGGNLKRWTNIAVALHVHSAMEKMTRMVRKTPLNIRER
jgi:hypothetical protein